MKRFFTTCALSVVALATLAGCGSVPYAAVDTLPQSPSALVAIRTDTQNALRFSRTALKTDEIKANADRKALESVVRNYRQQTGTALAHARGAAEATAYAARLDAARQRDTGAKTVKDFSVLRGSDLAAIAGDYQTAFKSVAEDLDVRLGVMKRERPE